LQIICNAIIIIIKDKKGTRTGEKKKQGNFSSAYWKILSWNLLIGNFVAGAD
jgi:hypothetical protein